MTHASENIGGSDGEKSATALALVPFQLFFLTLGVHKATAHIKASFERRKKHGWTTEITVWKRASQ